MTHSQTFNETERLQEADFRSPKADRLNAPSAVDVTPAADVCSAAHFSRVIGYAG